VDTGLQIIGTRVPRIPNTDRLEKGWVRRLICRATGKNYRCWRFYAGTCRTSFSRCALGDS